MDGVKLEIDLRLYTIIAILRARVLLKCIIINDAFYDAIIYQLGITKYILMIHNIIDTI